jgi:hypothetical protein
MNARCSRAADRMDRSVQPSQHVGGSWSGNRLSMHVAISSMQYKLVYRRRACQNISVDILRGTS